MFKLFDSHCHLQFPQYDADREEVLARMREKEVGAVLIGTDLASSTRGVDLVKQHDFLWASVGLHPNDNIEEQFDVEAFEKLAEDPKVVGIGECGLDYFRLPAQAGSGGTPEEQSAQKKRLEMQMKLAEKVGKPLIIHCRSASAQTPSRDGNAHDDMLALLAEKSPSVPVVLHFFTATAEIAQKYLDLGCYLSFPGPITYTDMYDESIKIAPLDKILSETDAPFAAPVPFRGKRNEPAYVEYVVAKIAAVKALPVEEVGEQIVNNTKKVFKI